MMNSMTAFGRAKREGENRDITVEIRSVNSRFFDGNVRMPRALSFLEEKIKAYVQKNAVSRAKVDISVSVDEHTAAVGALSLDTAYAESYIHALRELRDAFGLPDDITTMAVAANRDVFCVKKEDADADAAWEEIRPVLNEAIAGYCAMRKAEGARIEADLKAKVENVRQMTDEIERLSACDVTGYRDKLETRLRQILSDAKIVADENRILTECAIWADKIAIDEELVRLRSHFGAFYEIAALPEPSGRKLDFLMQEMNRETNTIGSKVNNAAIARIVVDVKGELEKMREQIQNIE